jgi:hypothetical protein
MEPSVEVLGTVPVGGEPAGRLPQLNVASLGDEQPQAAVDLLGEGDRDRPCTRQRLELVQQIGIYPDRTWLACHPNLLLPDGAWPLHHGWCCHGRSTGL